MHHRAPDETIFTNASFEQSYRQKAQDLITSPPVNRGPAHATTDQTMALTHELMHVRDVFLVDQHRSAWAEVVKPNLPWAEDHFQERVGGEPLNPAPSEAWWPFARQGNAEHKKGEKFSHTYPERFWPKYAGVDNPEPSEYWDAHQGVRFKYGDLDDLIEVLKKNPNSRQAYLPIWFPEDLTAARLGERVPCSMGYHFIVNGRTRAMDCVYSMRSCDIVRFYRDDIYMAGRLLQLVAHQAGVEAGRLVVNIDNLHCFPDDLPYLRGFTRGAEDFSLDRRSTYNFGALG